MFERQSSQQTQLEWYRTPWQNTPWWERPAMVHFLSPDSRGRFQAAPGEVYEFLYDMSTRAGHVHPKGSQLRVVDRTTKTPHGEVGPYGYNLVCETQFGTSCWSTLDQCLERKLLKRIRGV